MDRLITVAVFTLPHELAVVRARMEAEGITCFAKDENTVAAHPFYSNVIGGIKLQVPAEQVAQAREILAENGHWELVGSERPADPWVSSPLQVPKLPRLSPSDRRALAFVLVGVLALIIVLLA